MTRADLLVSKCFEDSEWHSSLWFPKVSRCVLGLPADLSDADLQACLLDLLDRGLLETGRVDGGEFTAFLVTDLRTAPDIYLRLRPLGSTRAA